MNLRPLILVSGLCLLMLACGQQNATSPKNATSSVQLETKIQKTSYAIGMDIGSNIAQGDFEIDAEALAQGLRDGLGKGGQPLMTEEELRETLVALQQDLIQKQMAMLQQQSSENKEKGAAFMEEFKKQEGVQSTESGILYRELTPGQGQKPLAEDIVTVHYTGTLVDGTQFDSSQERGEPATFPVGGVIPGWTEILQLMSKGAKWEVVIPAELAYGEQQAGPVITPNSTLVFEIELLDVVQTPDTQESAPSDQ
ncbi:MAG TPA: FKBP-type peptidyl-prolyl cis-trans isomerase [Desulfonatronum sp.]|nr:FKBP-type peptidyl-prolyl cis-trans isomerase [Desulfonatronum sp.]